MRLKHNLKSILMQENQLTEKRHQRQRLKSFHFCHLQHIQQPEQCLIGHLEKLHIQVSIELHLLSKLRVVIKSNVFLFELVPHELHDQL